MTIKKFIINLKLCYSASAKHKTPNIWSCFSWWSRSNL